MIAQEKIQVLDLDKTVPRSSKDTMAGIAHLPRMIDKARASRKGLLGEYIYPCPLDKKVLKFMKSDPKEFALLAESHDDGQMTRWAREHSRSPLNKEREQVNDSILNTRPDSSEMVSFIQRRNQIDPTRTDVTTWAELRDLQEGYI